MSPTAYRRSVSVGCCSSPRCRLHDTTWTESSSTPITKPSFEPSTAYQPGKRLSRVHEAGSRTGSIRVAVEKLDAPPEQRPRRPVRNRAELRLGSGNVEPAQSHHDDLGRERRELLPGTGSRPLAWGAADVLAARERHQLGNPVTGDVRRVEPFQHQYPRFPYGRSGLRPHLSRPPGLGRAAAPPGAQPRCPPPRS